MAEQRPAPGTAADLTARIAALEAENAQLRAAATARAAADASAGPSTGGGTGTPPPAPRQRHRTRAAAAVVLIVLGALLAPVAVVAVWAKDLVTDTDRYLATVGPLVDDPQIQGAVTNRVTGAIVEAADLDGLASDAVTAVEGLGLPPRVSALAGSLQAPLVDAATNVIRRAVDAVVTSDVFEAVWDEANRTVHDQLNAVLRGDPDAIASIDAQGTLVVDLTGVVDTVRSSLSDAGFTVVDRLPTISASFPLMQSADLVRAQNAYRLLDLLGTWLIWLSLGLLAAGVLAAVHRARALVIAGLSLAGAMLLLGAALTIGRSVYVDALPPGVQRPDAAVVVYDQVVAFLRVALRSAFVLGVVVALVAFLAGGTSAARSLRASWSRGATWLRTAGERRGISTGPVGVWFGEQRVLVRVVIGAGAALALVLAGHLTPAYVAVVAIVAVVLLAVTTLVARPPTPPAGPPPSDGAPVAG
ncbi:hypothetical protein [Cellulomonas sp. GbtcB1]|uniref:hypothetical protein n=1 Tax=Cellulomonas sp. GbtcB1 TaxID=2824746 RepID=UPI001C306280|nr:hypothetical protein [Cellulomonas sp. GbtcB1]